MALSARNRLSGRVDAVETGEVAAAVTIALDDGGTVTALITAGSVERLDLAEGDAVDAVVKATEVMVET